MGTIYAFLVAIPILKDFVERFITFYVAQQIAHMKQENRDGIRKAVFNHDQRDLEKAVGNPNAGEPTNLPGIELRDSLPRT